MVLANGEHDKWKGKHTKEKKITKEFNVNADALLKINNSYGNIDIVTWDENRIEFEITITTNGNNEEKVQRRLDKITVDFNASQGVVSAKTILNKDRSNSWWDWNNNSNVNMKINYIVKMPMTNSVDLDNDYGSINLGKLEGRANISCDYGKITTKELMADDNYIRFDYTNGCYFEYIKSGKINADYSSYTVGKTNALDISADYTKSVVEVAEDVTYDCDYGSLKVNKTNTFSGDGDYLTIRIGDLYKAASIKSDYGSIRIEKLHKNFGGLNINSDYTGIKIGYDPELSFRFEIDLEYSRLSGDEEWDIVKKRIESRSKFYSGYYGNGSTDSRLIIQSEYGGVTFFKN
jgi:hypothetical protein